MPVRGSLGLAQAADQRIGGPDPLHHLPLSQQPLTGDPGPQLLLGNQIQIPAQGARHLGVDREPQSRMPVRGGPHLGAFQEAPVGEAGGEALWPRHGLLRA